MNAKTNPKIHIVQTWATDIILWSEPAKTMAVELGVWIQSLTFKPPPPFFFFHVKYVKFPVGEEKKKKPKTQDWIN